MYGKTLMTKGALLVDGVNVGVLGEDGVTWSPEVEVLEIRDTSTMPQTVLERRPTMRGGTLSVSLAEISSANATLISKIYTQASVSVSYTATRAAREGGGSVVITMTATVSAASVRFSGDDWAVAGLTFKALGAPTITGLS